MTIICCLLSLISTFASASPTVPKASAPSIAPNAAPATARPPRILKFTGVPLEQGRELKKTFPFVFEREVSLSEVDEIVRYLMKTGAFANVEVVERPADGGGRELVLAASILRKIESIAIRGNREIPTPEILRILNITQGQTFERKNLLASSEDLRKAYEDLGYHNAKVEIEFGLPSDQGVAITVQIDESAPVKINEIVVDTPNAELTNKLKRMSRSLKSKALTEDTLLEFQKQVQEWFQENRYLTAKLSHPAVVYNLNRTQAKLTYTVENPWRFEFRIEGNKYFTEGSIIRQLEGEKLAGAVSSPAPDMAEKIRSLYQAVGFANVDVSYQDRQDEKSQKQKVFFKITENPRVRIKKIEITGNVSRPDTYYAQFIKTSSSDLIGSGYFNRTDFEDGAKLLVTELQNQGYLRAKVQSQRAEYSKDKKSVTVSLSIDEGPLTQIRQIRIEGADSFPKAQLLELLKVHTGNALGLRELEESIQILKTFYRSEGYLEMKITNENESSRMVTYNEANTQATIEFKIYEGPRVVVGSVVTSGNTFTKDYVIKREVSFKTGDVLTPDVIDDSVFRLQKLGLFGKVSIRMLEEGTNISERTIIVEVEERDPGLITTGFGINNDREPDYLTLRGYLGIGYRNIRGTGRGLSFRVDPRYSTDPRISYLEHTITISYLEPYLFRDRNRGRINLVRDQRFYDFSADKTSATILEEHAIGLLLEKDFTRHVKMTLTGYNFSNQRIFDRYTRDSSLTQNIAKFGPAFEFDYRDDTFNPTRGTYSIAAVEYSDPLIGSSKDDNQTINFFKVTAASTLYHRLNSSGQFVWANQLRGGYVANVSSDPKAGVPSQESFFLGSRSTIRGFDAVSERLPRLESLGVDDLRNFTVTNNETYYLIKSEIRFPLYGSFGGALFYDGGAILLTQDGVDNSNPYRHSVGAGLRFATPVGPLNFEIGWKLDPRTYSSVAGGVKKESPWAFHFSIGTF